MLDTEQNENDAACGGSDLTAVLGADDDIFADYPKYTPGQIGWGTLLRIVEWEQRHGIGSTSAETVRAYQEEGYGAAQAGVMLGLLDYGQATGCKEY